MQDGKAIRVLQLSKTFLVPTRDPGLRSALRSLFWRNFREVRAVDRISFEVDQGEIVGFLGPNGAGKTTTLKMLSGLLHPSSGTARVIGFEPSRRDGEFLRMITLVMGQRSQLEWDIPALDSFELIRTIYQVPSREFKQTRDELIDLLDLRSVVHKPVRNLSLGERMKVELVGALIHRPRILFLDEPTIGLDVIMQRRIRSFIRDYETRIGATVLVTSHYMADVVALCRRVIVIHRGRILFDGDLRTLADRFTTHKTIVVLLDDGLADLGSFGEVVRRDGGRVALRVRREEVPRVAAGILATYSVNDLTIEDSPIEDVIEQTFTQGGIE